MGSLLNDRLDLILENDVVDDDPYNVAMSLSAELDQARQSVADLERQWMHAVDRLCGGLAVGIRKHKPGLNVGLDNGCCRVGYRSKHLTMRPDMAKKVWVVDGSDPRFARRFMRRHGPHTGLINDLTPIARAVADFFTGHYRTLGEEIDGRGVIIMGGRSVGMGEVVELIEKCDRLLTERAAGSKEPQRSLPRRRLLIGGYGQ